MCTWGRGRNADLHLRCAPSAQVCNQVHQLRCYPPSSQLCEHCCPVDRAKSLAEVHKGCMQGGLEVSCQFNQHSHAGNAPVGAAAWPEAVLRIQELVAKVCVDSVVDGGHIHFPHDLQQCEGHAPGLPGSDGGRLCWLCVAWDCPPWYSPGHWLILLQWINGPSQCCAGHHLIGPYCMMYLHTGITRLAISPSLEWYIQPY
jgi:hypothetical protein